MNKYIDAEKLIAEIERLKDGIGIGLCEYDAGEENGKMEILTGLSSFIASLQQEQPEGGCSEKPNNLLREQPDNEDIDKVAQELYEHLYELKRRNNVPTNLYDKQEIIDLWKAGIEYGRNHPNQAQSEVDLEKDDIIHYVHSHFYYDKDFDGYGHSELRPVFTRDDVEVIARHFYELGRNARKK